ncbi:MAG: MFS transporter [Planctomycetes bacterium]|nr:MFS transporter [Planctomycetota bacterium]
MDLLHLDRLPFFARRHFYYELRQIVPWSVLAALIEGQFASVLVARTFHGGPVLIAVASASPFAAYVFSLLWGMLCVGRRKLRLLSWFAAGTAVCAAGAAIIPVSPAGGVWFIAQMALAQVLLAGVITVRSAIWRSNYPRELRGQVASRLQGVRSLISILTVQLCAAFCDRDPHAFRVIFVVVACFGALGVLRISRLRVRGERRNLRRAGPSSGPDWREDIVEPMALAALLSPLHVTGRMMAVLRRDRRFAWYCVAQFLQGAANLMTIPVVVAIVTSSLSSDDGWGFWTSTSLIMAIPTLALLGSLGRWGRLFDGLGVLRFRVVNVFCWAASIAAGLLGTLATLGDPSSRPLLIPLAVALFALRGILHGLGQGGGTLAWNLGHLHFAESDEAEVYMGIHVFLAGVRGLISPLLGMWLWALVGWPVWVVALILCLASLVVYTALARSDVRATRAG